jgi:hypothetical protein
MLAISLGTAFDMGSILTPRPAAGITAFVILDINPPF